jgi:flagellar biosynthesis protein FliQ
MAMSYAEVLEIGRDLIFTALLLALPALLASMAIGLIVSVFQAVTSIQEQTLSFVPRLIILAVVIVITMPWSLQTAAHFTLRLLSHGAEIGQ